MNTYTFPFGTVEINPVPSFIGLIAYPNRFLPRDGSGLHLLPVYFCTITTQEGCLTQGWTLASWIEESLIECIQSAESLLLASDCLIWNMATRERESRFYVEPKEMRAYPRLVAELMKVYISSCLKPESVNSPLELLLKELGEL